MAIMDSQGRLFLKPDISFYEFFKGYNVRGLQGVYGMTREEFWTQAVTIVNDAERIAKEEGLKEEDAKKIKMQTIRKLSEESLFFFAVFVLNMFYINNDFGYRLCLDVQENKWRRMWIIAREHFKTSIITCASTLWELLKDPNMTYCIYSYKEDTASTFLGQIKSWCENNAVLRSIWSDIIWKNPAQGYEEDELGRKRKWTWTSTAIELKRTIESKEMTIEAAGILGSSKTGYHFSRQIFDDVETQKNVETSDAIDKLYNQFSMSFNTGQTENMDFCIVGTFYARADVYSQVIKNGVVKEAIVQPCVDRDGESIHFSVGALEDKYRQMGPSVFATQMMCNPSFSTTLAFKAEWLHKWTPSSKGLNIYTVIDPASGKKATKGDYTAIWTVGIDAHGSIMIFDLVRDKLTVEERFLRICEIVRTFSPLQIYHEEVGMQADITMLEMLMDKYNTHFALIPFHPSRWGDKVSRIEKLKDGFEAGKIFIPRDKRYHINYEGRNEDMVDTWYREEYLGYPTILHDDGLDALATVYLLYIDRNLRTPNPKPVVPKRERGESVEDYSPMGYAEELGLFSFNSLEE